MVKEYKNNEFEGRPKEKIMKELFCKAIMQ